jgi:hypothetical protein
METRADNPPNGRSAGGDNSKKLGKRIEKVGNTAEHVWDRTRDSVSDIGHALDIQGRVQRNPYGTVAAAVGIGYVLGGGLFSPLTARIVRLGIRIGLRLAVLPLVKQEIAEMVETIDDEEGKGRGASKINVKRTRGDEP